MKTRRNPPLILVLGGTAEAREIAERLMTLDDVRLARARDLAAADETRPDFILDARHPFSTGGSEKRANLLRIWRPPWRPEPGDKWHEVADGFAAAALIPEDATVFVATGRGRLPELAGLRVRRVWWRRRGDIDRPFPFSAGGWLTDAGPFSEREETDLFRDLGVNWLITQNAGGAGAFPKLAAARRLGLDVAMIRRAARPEPSVEDADAAMDWVRRMIASSAEGA